MGVSLTPSFFDFTYRTHWSYDEFSVFRRRLAKDAFGVDLEDMKGFGGKRSWTDFDPDPLVFLLDHSDCDGELSSDLCSEGIAPRILEITKAWDDDPHMREKAKLLAEAIQNVADRGGTLMFG